MSHRFAFAALVLLSALLSGCSTAAVSGPRPTLPHPAWAPAVVAATPRAATHAGKPSAPHATPRPATMSDAEWHAAYCRAQDDVFHLEFAVVHVRDMAASRDITATRGAVRVLESRATHARQALLSVPPREARPLVDAELRFLRQMQSETSLVLRFLQTRAMADWARARVVERDMVQSWRVVVRLTQRMASEQGLFCRSA